MRLLGGLGLTAILLAPAARAQSSLANDAKMFGARESAWSVDVSPSGNKVVMLSAGPGRTTLAKVYDLVTGKSATAVSSSGNPDSLRWCDFASETQLVCQFSGAEKVGADIIGYSRLITVGAGGGAIKLMGQTESFHDERLRQVDGNILDWLPGENGSVLMARDYVPEMGRTGSNISRTKDGLGVDRIELATLKSTPVEPPRRDASAYLTDGRGQVRLLAIDEESSGSKMLTGVTHYRYRAAGSRDWEPLGDFDSRDGSGLQPLAIEAESDSIFILKKTDGRDALYRMKLSGSGTTTLIAADKKFDIDGVVRIGKGQRVIGYTFADEQRRTVYFDPEFTKLNGSLGKAIPKQPLVMFIGASADASKLLITASSDTHPGIYYLLDRKTKHMNELALVRPWLEGRPLATVKSISYAAADGTAIPAYLTIPAGSSGKGLPAVVLPHGGPSARDEWGFDWLAQFLASRGYAVIQPNYRGSAGFGDEWLNKNGFKGWRTSIGDVSAAARYLVFQGIADPKRMAIVGWSYGGYAALQSAAVEPDLYKAAVAIAPVTDLAMLKLEFANFTNANLVKDFVGSGPHVTEGSPLRNAAAIKAPVLLVHGDLDGNVGIAHSDKMLGALKKAGKQAEMLRYRDLDHQLDDTNARIEMLTRIGQFLETAIGH